MKRTETRVGNVKVRTYEDGAWDVFFWERRGDKASGGVLFDYDNYRDGHGFQLYLIPDGIMGKWDEGSVLLPPPSEDLTNLIANFHLTEAVAPLIDCLIENYPEVSAHIVGILESANV